MNEFKSLPRVFPEMPLWGVEIGIWSFVISKDGDEPYAASAKLAGSVPFQGTRYDLGEFDSFGEAEKACRKWARERAN